MKFNPQNRQRKSIRLKGYNYSQPGAYFVTLVTYQREMLFGEIKDKKMQLHRRGEIVRDEWFKSAHIRKEINLLTDEFVIMPNHLHGVVWIVETVGATGRSPLPKSQHNQPHGPAPKSLASFIAGFKSSVTRRIRDELGETGIWQRNYGACPEPRRRERIIRNAKELDAIYRYIQANPSNWDQDEENPSYSLKEPT